jgi:predicted phosphoribosyltransferase
MFVDRSEAGKKLAKELLEYKDKDSVVLAIPRGGVVVADKVAQELDCPLDLIIPRKIGAPGNPELAIGAVAGLNRVIINENIKRSLGVSEEYLKAEIERQLNEIERRRKMYLGEKPPLSLKDRVVILVDDGLATGYTAMAAISAIREEKPREIILAVPVAPRDTCELLSDKVDKLICLSTPEFFYAVGQFYVDFSQTTDDEVIEILSKYR